MIGRNSYKTHPCQFILAIDKGVSFLTKEISNVIIPYLKSYDTNLYLGFINFVTCTVGCWTTKVHVPHCSKPNFYFYLFFINLLLLVIMILVRLCLKDNSKVSYILDFMYCLSYRIDFYLCDLVIAESENFLVFAIQISLWCFCLL